MAAAMLPLLALQAGCYSIGPLEAGMPAPGARVVANLTPQGSESVAARLGPDVAEVEGLVESAADGGMTLGVTRVGQRAGGSRFVETESVELDRGALASVRQKRLNRGRSFLVGAVIIGGALLIAEAFGGVLFGEDGGGGTPVPPN